MAFTELGSIADLVAAFGVISSLIFVAFEIRKSSQQAGLSNWNSVLSGLREHKRRTDDPRVADLIVRGRSDFEALSEAEKLAFGYWMEEMVISYDGLIVHRHAIAVGSAASYRSAVEAFAIHFSYPGSVSWYHWSKIKTRWPEQLINAVEEGLSRAKAASN